MPSPYYLRQSSDQLVDSLGDASEFDKKLLGTIRTDEDAANVNKEVLKDYVAPISTVGLGRSAVLAEMGRIQDVIEERNPEIDDELLDEEFEIMADFTPEQREVFDDFIASQHPGEWLDSAIAGDSTKQGTRLNYVDLLTKKDENGQYLLDRNLRMNFLEWHNAALARLNGEFQEQKERYINLFEGKFKSLVEKGIIPVSALSHLERLKTAEFSVDDGLTTNLANILGHHISTYENVSHIVLAPSATDVDNDPRIFIHELMHAMQGMTVPEDIDASTPEWRENDNSGLERTFGWKGDRDGGLMLNEALTEELTLIAVHGGEATMDPDNLREGAYADERYLLAKLCTAGLEPIALSDFVAAYMEDGTTEQQEKLYSKLRAAFPIHDEEGKDIVEIIQNLNRHKLNDDIVFDEYYGEWDMQLFCDGLIDKNYEYVLSDESDISPEQRVAGVINKIFENGEEKVAFHEYNVEEALRRLPEIDPGNTSVYLRIATEYLNYAEVPDDAVLEAIDNLTSYVTQDEALMPLLLQRGLADEYYVEAHFEEMAAAEVQIPTEFASKVVDIIIDDVRPGNDEASDKLSRFCELYKYSLNPEQQKQLQDRMTRLPS